MVAISRPNYVLLVISFLTAAVLIVQRWDWRFHDQFLKNALLNDNTEPLEWPYGPFHTRGRNIVNAKGDNITFVGVNWPLSLETMIPEGLEFRSADSLLLDLSHLGFNYLRMGYSIQMVDDLIEKGGDIGLEESITQVLGEDDGRLVVGKIISNNPQWNRNTTRFQIWGDIIDRAARYKIYVHPDVHVGMATWCCSHWDGNSFFNDLNFSTSKWIRGLKYIALWAKNFPNVVSMSLRNELRESYFQSNENYNWLALVGNLTAGTNAIHGVNPELLVTWSGMNFDHDLSALTSGKNLNTAYCYNCSQPEINSPPKFFDLDSHPWANKIVWELHLYQFLTYEGWNEDTCDAINTSLYYYGANALGISQPPGCEILGECEQPVRITPVIITEFGSPMYKEAYGEYIQRCCKEFTIKNNVSWAMWVVAGSYRFRQGIKNYNETWGLLNQDWSDWRDPAGIQEHWLPWINAMAGIDQLKTQASI